MQPRRALPVGNGIDGREDKAMANVKLRVAIVQPWKKDVVAPVAAAKAGILKAGAVVERVAVRIARLEGQAMCLPLSRRHLQRVVIRASAAADQANAGEYVPIPELRVAREIYRLIGPVGDAAWISKTRSLSRWGDGITLDGGLVMSCQCADVSD